jgi:MFS family permease
MAGLQIPAGRLAERFGGGAILAIGTALTACGYVLAGFSGGLAGLCAALALSGAGASTQHPLASAAVSNAYGAAARGPLATYNFSGDIGKAVLPAATALLLTLLPWRGTLWLLASLGFAMAVAMAMFMPRNGGPKPQESAGKTVAVKGRGGFPLLFGIGVLDSGVRMGLLTFLPFLLQAKGAGLPVIGFALSLVFIGGAAGKFACGWMGVRFGVLKTVLLTETGTAAAILAILVLPLEPALVLLPLLGVMLNGTSSVLYGTVAELVTPERRSRAYGLYYTVTIACSAVAPTVYGVVSDAIGVSATLTVVALVVLVTIPLCLVLRSAVAVPVRA